MERSLKEQERPERSERERTRKERGAQPCKSPHFLLRRKVDQLSERRRECFDGLFLLLVYAYREYFYFISNHGCVAT